LQKLLQELTERINILISDRNSLIKENNYLRAIFCIDQEEKLPSFAECDERWNKIVENKWEQEKRITTAETALTGSLILINAIYNLQHINSESNFAKLLHSAHNLIVDYDTKYK
jgi:hypothetical protein